jgi:hypothetical protein
MFEYKMAVRVIIGDEGCNWIVGLHGGYYNYIIL